MTTIKITIDDSLPFAELKTILSLIRGVTKVEITDFSVDSEKKEYELLKTAFLNSSKRFMAQQLQWTN